jgi:hypothetical protein
MIRHIIVEHIGVLVKLFGYVNITTVDEHVICGKLDRYLLVLRVQTNRRINLDIAYKDGGQKVVEVSTGPAYNTCVLFDHVVVPIDYLLQQLLKLEENLASLGNLSGFCVHVLEAFDHGRTYNNCELKQILLLGLHEDI